MFLSFDHAAEQYRHGILADDQRSEPRPQGIKIEGR